MRLSYIVSSHGFGHAARAAAVIEHLAANLELVGKALDVQILAGTPRWFFDQSLRLDARHRISYVEAETDLGLVQTTALEEDLEASHRTLERWFIERPARVGVLADKISEAQPHAVICDISPWGLEAARDLSLPTVLIENFTWDFIYAGYHDPRLDEHAERLAPLFDADLHLRATPACGPPREGIEIPPIARQPRLSRSATRASLGIPDQAHMVLVTMGGVPWDFGDLEQQLSRRSANGSGDEGSDPEHSDRERFLVIAGGAPEVTRHGQAILIPHRSDFYHPDLVHASDAVVGKLGYSTVAEIAAAGSRFAYVPRRRFAESPCLEEWVDQHLCSQRLDSESLIDGSWIQQLDALLAKPTLPSQQGGAELAAEKILASIDTP